MEVAIIGTGNVGGALARSLTRAGHSVVVTSTTPEEAEALANEVGGRAVGSNREAAEAAGVVIGAVYFDAIGSIVDEIGGALDGKVLIDVSNRAAVDGNPGLAVDGASNAEQIQARAPGAKVVKAFNTAFAARQADPEVDGTPIDGFVAGSDAQAKATVLELVSSTGMNAVDAGPLESARILEAMGTLIIWLNMQGGTWQNAWKILEPGASG